MIEKIITGDLGVNTYLYNYKENRTVIIDPGSDFAKIVTLIESKKYNPTGILLTHGHFDHIGAVEDLKTKYCIPTFIHSLDATFLGDEGNKRHLEMFMSMGGNGNNYFKNYYKYNSEVNNKLTDGDYLEEFGLSVIHTPGHSPGSSCFYSKENSILFTGDTLFKNGVGRTDFIGGDYNTLLKSIQKIFKLPGNTKIYPGHGDSSKLELES